MQGKKDTREFIVPLYLSPLILSNSTTQKTMSYGDNKFERPLASRRHDGVLRGIIRRSDIQSEMRN